MESWKKQNELIIDQMWKEHRSNSFGVCMICSRCGGSSSSFCSCARERWITNISREHVNAYQEKLRQQEIARRIQYEKEEIARRIVFDESIVK